MTREEHLTFCKVCKNQKFDYQKGIICSLTDQIADFETHCQHYVANEALISKNNVTQAQEKVFVHAASLGKRFTNYILDLIFMYIFGVILGIILGILLAFTAPHLLQTIDFESKLITYPLGFVIGMLYYTIFESASGRTIAKYITKTQTVTHDLEVPGFGAILLRSLCRFIPFEGLSFFGSQGWHDKFSKTYVIDITRISKN